MVIFAFFTIGGVIERDGGDAAEVFGSGLFLSTLLWIPGGVCWGSGRKKIGEIKRTIASFEDLTRRAKSIVITEELGKKLEAGLDNIRSEISDLYLGKIKWGEVVNKKLSDAEEALRGCISYAEKGDVKGVSRQISLSRDIVADLRSLFRR